MTDPSSTDPSSTDPSVAQPDDEQPVTETPAERGDERQAKPEHELQNDDDLQAGQFEPGA